MTTDQGAWTLVFTAPPVVDEFGDVVTPGATQTITGCNVYPRGSSEEGGPRDTTVVTGNVALLPRLPQPVDGSVDWSRGRVTDDLGRVHQIEGEFGVNRYLDGTLASYQVALKRVNS